MKNYITIYNFANPSTTESFKKQLKELFPYNLQESSNGLPYFAFAAKEEPEVEDKLRHAVNTSDIADEDFIALYFTREHNTDQIKRVMIIGTDDVLDERLTTVPEAEHNNQLIDMLEADIAKQKADEQG